jgi:hypothetical protein
MHTLPENLRSSLHRTNKYGYAPVLDFQTECTILQKSFCA